MLSILVMIRDALVAMALAWVGVTLEATHAQADQSCRGETCQTQSQH
jgi:hypothetical protein